MVKIYSQIVLSAGLHSISQLASSAHDRDRDLPKTKEYERTAKRERSLGRERAPILSILRSHCNFSPLPGTRGIPSSASYKDDEYEFGDEVGTPFRFAPSPSGRVSDVTLQIIYSLVTKSDVSSVASRQALSKRDAFRD